MTRTIKTSHVGSFPLKHDDRLIPKILRNLHETGLDVPPYPQMRSFIDIFLEPLAQEGLLARKGDFYFSSPDLLSGETPPKVKIPEASIAVKVIKEQGLHFDGLRGPVTGAFTLASRVYLDRDVSKGLKVTALARPDLIEDFFVRYVRNCLEHLRSLGYDTLFIDEPILGVIVGRRRVLFGYSSNDIAEIISAVYEGITGVRRGIHVCGTVSRLLLETLAHVRELDVINLEFHDSRPNLGVIDADLLKSSKKLLAPGIASSRKSEVEPVDELLDLLRTIYERVEGRIDLVSADCGFGGLKGALDDDTRAYEVGLAKLRSIVEAVRILNKKQGEKDNYA